MSSILLKNALVLTQDSKRRVLKNHDVLVENEAISEVGASLKRSAEQVIDCSGKLVMPGLVNAHTHLAMSLLRGFGEDVKLQDWLEKKIWPLEAKLNEDDIYWGSMLACAESIRCGVTSIGDMYFLMDAVAKAVGKSGLRANLSYGMIDLGDPEKRMKELSEGQRFFKEYHGSFEGRLTCSLGPHAPYSCSRELLEKTRDISEKLDCLVQIHVAETRKELFETKKKTGKRVVEYLGELGLLSPRLIASHVSWVTKQEITLLGKARANAVLCTISNMKLATGALSPLPELLRAGVNVAFGTDGAASNNSLNLLETAKISALAHKNKEWDACSMPVQQAFDVCTIGGARALGLNSGSIEKGKLADLVVVDLKAPNMVPAHNPVANMIYSSNPGNVVHVVCNGNIVMHDRRITLFDEQEAVEKASERSAILASGCFV